MQEITQGSVQTGALYFLTIHYNKHCNKSNLF